MSDFELWMGHTFVTCDPTIDRRPTLFIRRIEHPHRLTTQQAARLACYITEWLGAVTLKELFLVSNEPPVCAYCGRGATYCDCTEYPAAEVAGEVEG